MHDVRIAQTAALVFVHVANKICSADVIISDYVPPTPLTDANVNGHLLFGASGRSVVTTIARGKVLMENRVLLGIDERAVAARARELAVKT